MDGCPLTLNPGNWVPDTHMHMLHNAQNNEVLSVHGN